MSTSAKDLTPETLLAAKDTSYWLKSALESALNRDPVDSLNDALALAGALEERLRRELGLAAPSKPQGSGSPIRRHRITENANR
jgi:hypothetical protein